MKSLIIATRKAATLAYDNAPLGFMIVVVLALVIGILDYSFGQPGTLGYLIGGK